MLSLSLLFVGKFFIYITCGRGCYTTSPVLYLSFYLYVCESYNVVWFLVVFYIGYFVLYISYVWVILPFYFHYICVFINMFVNVIYVFTAICWCT